MSQKYPMRRKDRDVTDFQKIVEIIDHCEILRIGLADGDCPYIVPVNFGYTVEGEQICFYIHGAMAGRKYELLRSRSVCAFEMDINHGIQCIREKGDVTTKYASVMGEAAVESVEGDEKQRVIDEIIMGRTEETKDFPYHKTSVPRTAVFRLKVTDLSAKSNIKGEADL